ncbi:Oidioi.mRNA.OKI2018_I69.XSR.g15437.t1.cds [Oikopleura dioica]|uniref:Oidioi.mRNA.OKI2018_I69.XSR.g15437.t1.cds n=1 Tax=Oikopleura dioica TaxID=34765 RepID=A0ABN7SCV5_OIKDI|nr:Oidioi.mRNA.OKI2018_I69.XSR.g15437.t1.cds [Oikopleura dioica]
MGSRDKKSKEKKSRRDRSPGSRSKSRRRDKNEKSREDRSKKSSKRHRRDKESPRRSKERKSKDKKSRSQSRERRKNGKSSKKSSRRDRSRSRERRKDRGGRDDRRGGGRDDRRGGRDADKYSGSYSDDVSRDEKYGKETDEYYEYENYPDRWNQVHAAHKVSYALSHGNRTSDEGGNRWPVTEQGFGGQILSPAGGRMQQLNLVQGNMMNGQFPDPRMKLGKSFRKVMFLNRLFYRTPSEDDKPVKVPSKIQPSSFAKSILKKTNSDFSTTSAKSNGDSTNGDDNTSIKSSSGKANETTEKLKAPGEILKPGCIAFERKVLKSLSDESQSESRKGREWKVDIFECCDYMDTCPLGIIPCMLGAELAEKISEPISSFLCCAGVGSVRTKFRTRLSIVGDACGDCALSFFCCCCVLCQLANEVDKIQNENNEEESRGSENVKTQEAPKEKKDSTSEDEDDDEDESDDDSDDSDDDDSEEESSD